VKNSSLKGKKTRIRIWMMGKTKHEEGDKLNSEQMILPL
jgi:hypothetical protein